MTEFLTAKLGKVTIAKNMAILQLDTPHGHVVGTVLTTKDIIAISSRMRDKDRKRILSALSEVETKEEVE